MMEKGFSKVKLLKIDCEGYEFEALKGAAESLRRKAFENLLIEYHPRQLRELGQNPGEIEAYLGSMGYEKTNETGINLFHVTR